MKKNDKASRGGARGRSKIKKDNSSDEFSRSRSRLKAVSPSDLNKKNSDRMNSTTVRKPRSHTDIRGYSIGLKMSIIFGFLVAVMVFISLLVLSSIVESSLEDEIKASGVKSTVFLSETTRIMNEVYLSNSSEEGINHDPNANRNMQIFYESVGESINTSKVGILCAAVYLYAKDKQSPYMSSFKQYSIETVSPVVEVVGGVKVERKIFKIIEKGDIKIPCFKFEKTVIDPKTKAEIGKAVVYISMSKVKEVTSKVRGITYVVAFIGAAIGLLVAYMFSQTLSKPILLLLRDIQIVSGGDFEHRTKASSKDEIGTLAKAFDRMTENLRYQQELEVESERRMVELSHAKEIQQRLLPRRIPNLRGIDLHFYYQAAKDVSGDYYDVMPVNEDHVAFLVADVSGKGIPGSMVMTEIRTILQIIRTSSLSTKKIMSRANRLIASDIKPGMFVTMMYCILNLKNNVMLVSSAGHNPLLIQRATGEYISLNPKGIALGFDKGPIFDRVIAEQKIQLYKGDRIVLYTDGIVEAMSPEREEYGDDRMDEFVKRYAKISSKDFVDKLMDELKDHQDVAEQHDDITILTFKV
ncbi:MAG: hypothetical protein COA79_08945 [Planctomycetota bacterium]|nr:MAG: hypothetical protein COA79_08945 [Planctomycetota bacterium]